MRFPIVRVLSALVAFAIAVVVMWAGLPLLAPVYYFLCVVALQEYSSLVNLRGIPIRKRSLWVATLLTLPASLPVTYPGMQSLVAGVSWRELTLGLFVIYLITLEVIKPNQNSMNAIIYTLFGYIYIPYLMGFAISLRYTPDGNLGLWYLVLPMLAVIASDVGAYTVGSLFGKRKLAPQISPNKTLEGAFGGLGLAIFVVTLTSFALDRWGNIKVDIYDGILFAVLVASAAQLGDLFESLFKRWSGVKDSGTFMPGHGGVLDRIDSALFAIPVTYYFVTLVILR
jgi:phosphatidate cytidylyltransferase